MKRQLALVMIGMLFASSSFATKARLSALQFADFWKDDQNVFTYTQYASDLGQYVVLELGPTGTTSTGVHAQGGFAKKWDDAIVGGYLGQGDATINAINTAAAVNEQSNPLFVYYARGNMGFGLNLSYSDTKSTGSKETTVGGSFGMKAGNIDFGSNLTVYSKSEKGTVKAQSIPLVSVAANMPMGDAKVYGRAGYSHYKVTNATETTTSDYNGQIGWQDQGVKLASKGTFFYGTQLTYVKVGAAKNLALPIYTGIEQEVMSWATVRGSISQNLYSLNKNAANDTNTNNTSVGFGATFKYGNFGLDGLLAAGTNGNVNGTSFLTSASATYTF